MEVVVLEIPLFLSGKVQTGVYILYFLIRYFFQSCTQGDVKTHFFISEEWLLRYRFRYMYSVQGNVAVRFNLDRGVRKVRCVWWNRRRIYLMLHFI